jgi:regulator of replication initiation timing
VQTNFVLDKMEELQASMQQMLKNFGEMRVEVKSMTNEMQAFRQQLDDFGEDMDRVKRRVNEMEKSATQVRVEIPQASKGVATARMTNHGPPLLDTSLHSTGTAVFTTTPSSPKDAVDTTSAGDFVVRPRRHDFPRFSGETPLLWVDLCQTYFEMYHVPEHH